MKRLVCWEKEENGNHMLSVGSNWKFISTLHIWSGQNDTSCGVLIIQCVLLKTLSGLPLLLFSWCLMLENRGRQHKILQCLQRFSVVHSYLNLPWILPFIPKKFKVVIVTSHLLTKHLVYTLFKTTKVRSQKKKRYYLGIFPKRRPPPTPPFWEPLIQKRQLWVSLNDG